MLCPLSRSAVFHSAERLSSQVENVLRWYVRHDIGPVPSEEASVAFTVRPDECHALSSSDHFLQVGMASIDPSYNIDI